MEDYLVVIRKVLKGDLRRADALLDYNLTTMAYLVLAIVICLGDKVIEEDNILKHRLTIRPFYAWLTSERRAPAIQAISSSLKLHDASASRGRYGRKAKFFPIPDLVNLIASLQGDTPGVEMWIIDRDIEAIRNNPKLREVEEALMGNGEIRIACAPEPEFDARQMRLANVVLKPDKLKVAHGNADKLLDRMLAELGPEYVFALHSKISDRFGL